MSQEAPYGGRFDLNEVMNHFPETSSTMIMDHYITDSKRMSTRVFRVYHAVPPHYHTQCDEVLYVMSGHGTFWINDAKNAAPFKPGHMIVFPRKAIHAVPFIEKEPVIFLAIDTPRRDPKDVIFVDPQAGDAQSFIQQVENGKQSVE